MILDTVLQFLVHFVAVLWFLLPPNAPLRKAEHSGLLSMKYYKLSYNNIIIIVGAHFGG